MMQSRRPLCRAHSTQTGCSPQFASHHHKNQARLCKTKDGSGCDKTNGCVFPLTLSIAPVVSRWDCQPAHLSQVREPNSKLWTHPLPCRLLVVLIRTLGAVYQCNSLETVD